MLFLLLRAEFVAAAQVIVYAGAVMVLYVFVVGYVGGMEAGLAGPTGRGMRIVSVLFAFSLFVELAIALIGSGVDALGTEGAAYKAQAFGEPGRESASGSVPDGLPGGLRGRLAAAADRGGRRRDPRAPPLRAVRRARDLGRRVHAPRDRGRRTRSCTTATGRTPARPRHREAHARAPGAPEAVLE